MPQRVVFVDDLEELAELLLHLTKNARNLDLRGPAK